MKGEKNLEIFDKWSINFSWKQDDTEKFLTEDLIFHSNLSSLSFKPRDIFKLDNSNAGTNRSELSFAHFSSRM